MALTFEPVGGGQLQQLAQTRSAPHLEPVYTHNMPLQLAVLMVANCWCRLTSFVAVPIVWSWIVCIYLCSRYGRRCNFEFLWAEMRLLLNRKMGLNTYMRISEVSRM